MWMVEQRPRIQVGEHESESFGDRAEAFFFLTHTHTHTHTHMGMDTRCGRTHTDTQTHARRTTSRSFSPSHMPRLSLSFSHFSACFHLLASARLSAQAVR